MLPLLRDCPHPNKCQYSKPVSGLFAERHGRIAYYFFVNRLIPLLRLIWRKLRTAFKELVPIMLLVGFFQAVVIKQPLPDVVSVLSGALMVVVGLMPFVEGLEMGLFPIGESLANALTRKGSAIWLLSFAFFLGFSTTIAAPALIAVADEAARMAVQQAVIEPGVGIAFVLPVEEVVGAEDQMKKFRDQARDQYF